MATETKLRQLADKGCPVYYFYSRTVASSSLSAVRMRVMAVTACRTRYRSLE